MRVNESKFLELLRDGALILVCFGTIVTSGGCDEQESVATVQVGSLASDSSNNAPDNDKKQGIYDFEFANGMNIQTKEPVAYDWTETINQLEMDSCFNELVLGNDREYCKYGIALYCNPDNEKETNYRIIDYTGETISESTLYTYSHSARVGNYITVMSLGFENDDSEMRDYIIFNHVTGETKEMKSAWLYPMGDYLKLLNIEGDERYYQLLYSNGELASEDKYSSIIYDEKTGNIFLVNSTLDHTLRKTEVLDPSTGKTIQIDGTVSEVFDNYVILESKSEEGFGTGVYYLEDFNEPLIEKIPNYYSSIAFVDRNNSVPMVVGAIGNKYYLESVNNDIYSKAYDYIAKSEGEVYFSGYNNFGTEKQTISYIDYNGTEIISDVPAKTLRLLSTRNAVIYKECGENGKCGLMDLNKNIFIEAEYDLLYEYNYDLSDSEATVIIGDKTVDGVVERTVFDKNTFNKLGQGPADEITFNDIASGYYGEYTIDVPVEKSISLVLYYHN